MLGIKLSGTSPNIKCYGTSQEPFSDIVKPEATERSSLFKTDSDVTFLWQGVSWEWEYFSPQSQVMASPLFWLCFASGTSVVRVSVCFCLCEKDLLGVNYWWKIYPETQSPTNSINNNLKTIDLISTMNIYEELSNKWLHLLQVLSTKNVTFREFSKQYLLDICWFWLILIEFVNKLCFCSN